jgi:dTDP-4-dehydrorhamnose reductase
MDLNRVLVTGGAGMIGRALPWGVKCSREELDVRDLKRATEMVQKHSPSAILHLANLDIRTSQADALKANETNVIGSYNMALVARQAHIPLIFVSSGAIFSGKKGESHDELSEPNPCNVYGQGKQLAEIIVRETLDDHLIVRTGWIFGGNQAHRKKFVEIALGKAKRHEPIDAAVDQWGSPTSVFDFCEELARLLKASTRGLIHVANAGSASPADIAEEIIKATGSRSKIHRVKRDKISTQEPPRAECEVLVSRHIGLRSWRESLNAYIESRQAP